jgi:hypothetical protein
MAKSHRLKYAIILLAVLGGGYILYANPDLISNDVSNVVDTATGNVDDSATIQTYVGDLTQRVSVFDSEDGTEYGEDTETDTIFYKKTGTDSYQRLIAPDSTSTHPNSGTVDITSDLKTIYAEVHIQSGFAGYVDANKIVDENSRVIASPDWADPNNDGRDTFIFPVDVTGYNSNPNQTPAQTLRVYLIDEGSLTMDSPADVTVTSTGKQRCNIKWSLDMDNAGDGEAVTLLRATLNSTDITDWYVNDSGIKFPTGTDPDSAKETIKLNTWDDTLLASTFQYEKTFGAGDLNDSKMLISPNNGETNFEIPFELYVNMDSANGVQVTLLAQTISANGTPTTTSDTVICTE